MPATELSMQTLSETEDRVCFTEMGANLHASRAEVQLLFLKWPEEFKTVLRGFEGPKDFTLRCLSAIQRPPPIICILKGNVAEKDRIESHGQG